MGIKQDIKDSLKKFNTTKIDRHPTNEDMNQLTQELRAMLATIPTTMVEVTMDTLAGSSKTWNISHF